jgi:hypothetical protein
VRCRGLRPVGLTSFGSIFILPLFLQQLRGYSILDSGLSQMPRMLVMMVAAPLAGRLYSWVDSRLVIGGGIVMMIGGYVQIWHLRSAMAYSAVAPTPRCVSPLLRSMPEAAHSPGSAFPQQNISLS